MRKFYVLLFVTILISCQINNEEIKVIDGIRLGITEESYNKSMKEAKRPFTIFHSNDFIYSKESYFQDLGKSWYYSEAFNIQKYQSNRTKHLGVFYPIVKNNQNIVTELVVLIGHTQDVIVLTQDGKKNFSLEDNMFGQAFIQTVRPEILDEIEKRLITKYGKPEKVLSEVGIPQYKLDGKNIIEDDYQDYNPLKILKWNTEYLDITFFYGAVTDFTVINKNTNQYISNSDIYSSKNEFNENRVYFKPYISYKLNEKYLKKKKLDVPNI